MNKYNLPFCYKGSRNYINGTDIYLRIFNLLIELYKDVKLSEFSLSFQKRTNTQNDIYISEPKESVTYPDGFSSRFICNTSKGKVVGYLFENKETINCRHPYHEEELTHQFKCNDSIIGFFGETNFSTIEVIVAMTKYLHIQKLKGKHQGKWLFSKLETKRPFTEEDKKAISINLIKNLNFKLTKSQITCNGEVLGYIFFSLVGENKW